MIRAEARVDLDAVRANLAVLRAAAGDAEVMAVVKADGYGHGMVPVARAARSAGAGWLGVAFPGEALALRAAGDTGRVLAWLITPHDDVAPCVAADVDLSVSAPWAVDLVAAAADRAGRPARVHLKVDTGLGRGGGSLADWPALVDRARRHEAGGALELVGVWSHLANGEVADDPETAAQQERFAWALAEAERAGLRPQVRHLANSGATLAVPGARFDLVRCGIAMYGLTPGLALGTSASLGLRPAMTLRAEVALAKRVPAGHGVSYGLTWTAPAETTLALVPVGYGDGIPRAASGSGPVLLGGRIRRVVGRVAMDQCVVDVGDDAVAAGDPVVLFGPGDDGEPTAEDWAIACGTIGYEIVTRLGPRVPRRYVGEDAR